MDVSHVLERALSAVVINALAVRLVLMHVHPALVVEAAIGDATQDAMVVPAVVAVMVAVRRAVAVRPVMDALHVQVVVILIVEEAVTRVVWHRPS